MWNIDTDFVSSLWADAANLEPDTLNALLETAHIVCVAFAPPLAEDAPVPPNYLVAEIMQAKDIFSKIGGGNASSFGSEGYETPVYPLTFAARDLLRPKTSPLRKLR